MRQSAIHTLIYAYDVNGTLLDSSRIYVLNSNGKLMAEYIKRGGSWRLEHYYPFGKEVRGFSTLNEPKEQFIVKESYCIQN